MRLAPGKQTRTSCPRSSARLQEERHRFLLATSFPRATLSMY